MKCKMLKVIPMKAFNASKAFINGFVRFVEYSGKAGSFEADMYRAIHSRYSRPEKVDKNKK